MSSTMSSLIRGMGFDDMFSTTSNPQNQPAKPFQNHMSNSLTRPLTGSANGSSEVKIVVMGSKTDAAPFVNQVSTNQSVHSSPPVMDEDTFYMHCLPRLGFRWLMVAVWAFFAIHLIALCVIRRPNPTAPLSAVEVSLIVHSLGSMAVALLWAVQLANGVALRLPRDRASQYGCIGNTSLVLLILQAVICLAYSMVVDYDRTYKRVDGMPMLLLLLYVQTLAGVVWLISELSLVVEVSCRVICGCAVPVHDYMCFQTVTRVFATPSQSASAISDSRV